MKKWFCRILRNYHVKSHKKSVAGQSVDKETEVKDVKQRPMIKIDMDRHASKESEFVDEDLLRIEVSDRRRSCSCFGHLVPSLKLSFGFLIWTGTINLVSFPSFISHMFHEIFTAP